MNSSTKYELSVIMDNLKEMKRKYIKLEEDYRDLEMVYSKQKERFGLSESRRQQLIKLFREKVDKLESYKAEMDSLRKENSNLNVTIQDQNSLINEYSATIEQLKKENALLKSKRNDPKNITEKGIQKPNQVTHLNGNLNFSHPSFDTTTDVKKKKKKSPLNFQNRYSNLDISVNGSLKKEEATKQHERASAKKRRLFSSLEDEMIDLTIESHE